MTEEIKDYTASYRFLVMRRINRRFIFKPLPTPFRINMGVQHKIGKVLLPRVSGHMLVPTAYGFPMEIGMDISHTSSMRGSIERNLYFLGTYEPGTLNVINLALTSRGCRTCFVEVGAHNGFMSIYAALSGAGRVFSFEPNPSMFSLLERNIERSGFSNITAFPMALGDVRQTVGLETNIRNSGLTSVVANGIKGSINNVQMETLDAVAHRERIGHVHLMLIDVEGYEQMVLNGAEGVVACDKPDLIVEYDAFDRSSPEILTFLQRHNYSVYVLRNSKHVLSDLVPFETAPKFSHRDNLFCFQKDRVKILGIGDRAVPIRRDAEQDMTI